MAAAGRSEKLKAFISYSRRDSAVADAIVDALIARGLDVTIDRRDLPFGEKWQGELSEFIRLSDTVIWLISEESIGSKWVNWELDEVSKRNKRLVPVVVSEVDRSTLPRQLGEIHILPAAGIFDVARDLDALVQVLNTDRAWLKQGSRLQDRAVEWLSKGRAGALLLSSRALHDAESWKDSRPARAPAPAPEVLDLLLASRRAGTRRQRVWMISLTVLVGAFAALAAWADLNRRSAEQTRALSDFRQGTIAVDTPDNLATALAGLARAVRANLHPLASTRLWTFFQQHDLWLPAPSDSAGDAQREKTVDLSNNSSIPSQFTTAKYDGKKVQVHSIAICDDGSTIFGAAGDNFFVESDLPLAFKVWSKNGTTLIDWTELESVTGRPISKIQGHLSSDGKFLAVQVTTHSGQYVTIFHLPSKKRIGGELFPDGKRADRFNWFNVIFFKAATTPSEEDATLLVASEKGDATQFEVDPNSVREVRQHRHAEAAVFIDVELNKEWLMSASRSGEVLVSDEFGAVGQPLQIDVVPRAIVPLGEGKLAIDAAGKRLMFSLNPRLQMRQQRSSSSPLATAKCISFTEGDDDPVDPVTEEIVEEKIELPDGGIVRRSKPNMIEVVTDVVISEIFNSRIQLVCVHAEAKALSVTTADFSTQIYQLQPLIKLGPVLREATLFAKNDAPQETLAVTLSDDGRLALIHSYFIKPPTQQNNWISAWDIVTGLPLMGRFHFGNYSRHPDLDEARLSSDGDFILLTSQGETPADLPIM